MKKTKQKINTLDLLISKLAEEFIKIPNFDMLQTDSIGNAIFNMFSFRLADISSYKELVVNHFVPATNKAIFDSKAMVCTSQFKDYLHIKESHYDETVFQTVRLGYVGLFHKMESF